MQEINDFEEIKLVAENLYNTFEEVYCPYFKEKVIFNSGGLEHLKFKQPRKARSEQDQYMRFKLLHLAPIVISLSSTVQGIRVGKSFEEVKINSRREFILKEVTYYEFLALIKRNRIKVIIKVVENGPKMFWSIVPFWKIDKKNNQRILHFGFDDY